MIKLNNRRSRAMMTSVSVVAMCALAPGLALAQDTLTGGPDSALTAGVITVVEGDINDFGPGNGVSVSGSGVLVDGAVIETGDSRALSISGSMSTAGLVDVTVTGATDLLANNNDALGVFGGSNDVILDLSAGGATFTSNLETAVRADSFSGDVTILNGANTISGGRNGIYGAVSGVDSTLIINSTGGTIFGGNAGIEAQGELNGGASDIIVGQGEGVTSAITSNGNGIRVVTSGSGTVSVTTGEGGTIDAAQTGVFVDTLTINDVRSATDITINLGDTVHGDFNGVFATTGAADVVINATGEVTSNAGTAIYGGTTTGSVTITSGDASGGLSAISASAEAGSVGDLTYTLVGPATLSGSSAVVFYNRGAGDISITAADAGSLIQGDNATLFAETTSGDITIDVAGALTGGAGAVVRTQVLGGAGGIDMNIGSITGGVGGGIRAVVGGTGALTIETGAVDTTAGGIGIEGIAQGGEINVLANGPVAAMGSGIDVETFGAGDVTVLTGSTVSSVTGNGIAAVSGTGDVSIGTAEQRLGGDVSSTNITALFAASAGDVSVYAQGVTGGTRGIVAASQYANPNGKVTIDVTGAVVGQTAFGIIGVNNGVLADNTLTIRSKDVTSTGGSAISAQAEGGDIDIVADGDIVANAAANGTWDGIYAEVYQDANVSVLTTGTVTGSFVGIDAFAQSATTQGAITITALDDVQGQTGVRAVSTGAGPITIDTADVTGTYGAGVFASGAADVSISTGAVTSLDGLATAATGNSTVVSDATFQSGFGVIGQSSGGSVSIDAGGLVTGGPAGGILAQVTAGTGDITVNTADITAAVGRGIEAQALGGDIVIDVAGDIASASNGVYAINSAGGAITVTASGAITSASGNGVVATNTGAGSTSIGTAEQRLAGPVTGGTTGLFATSTGDVSIYAGAVTGATRGLVAASQGTNPNGKVVIDLTGPVVGQSSFGVIGVNNGVLAENTISITATDSVTSTNGSAISAQTVNGDITINAASVTANAGPNNATWDGVFAQAQGDALIDITTTGAVFGTFNGIEALTGGDGTRGGITISALGDVEGSSTLGIRALSTGGDIAVSTGGAVSGAQGGISTVVTGAGSIAIEAAGLITTTGFGISATTESGDITISTLAGADIAPGAALGILAQTDTGSVSIDQAGDIGAIDEGMTVPLGIYVTVASGDSAVNIVSSGGIYVTPGEGFESAGIYVAHAGTGAINVATSGIIDPGAYGVVLQGGGDVTYAADGGLVEGDTGVFLASTGGGDVSFTSTEGTEIIGLNGAGVTASTGDGDLNLMLDGTIAGATTGVIAASTGDGSTTLVTDGDIVGGSGPGIEVASGTGGLNLTVNGVVASATGSAINATSAGGATINVGEGAVITGLVDDPDMAVINLTTASGLTSTINVAEGGVVAAADGSAFNVAIRAEGGSVVVNNEGTIAGTVDFSALTGENTGELVSGPDTVFLTGGTSTFSAGDDNFNNGGVLATLGELTTFDFREGTNVFTNSGVTQVGFNPISTAGSRFSLLNVDSFNNSGTLEMANDVAGDSIVAEGSDFIGSGASLLSIDTEVGQLGGASDTLTIGQSSGVTGIRINDVSTGFSGLDTKGVLLVSGDTSDGDFVLDAGSSNFSSDFGGVINTAGLFMGQLATDARGTVLITAPKTEAYQFATLGAQAQSVWRATAGSGERQAQRRDRMAANTGQGLGGLNVWADVQGLAAQRDVDQSYGATSHEAGYDQDVVTATFGVEGVQAGHGGLVSYGASLGYVTSDTQFDARRTEVDMTGAAFTAHVGYLSPAGLFGAAAVVGNVLEAEVDAAELNGFSEQEVGINTLGGSLEVGVRRAFAFNAIIEPSVSVTYSDTHVDTLGAAGSTIRFADTDSLRAAVGVRMSGDVGSTGGAWRTRYTLGGAVVNEFSAENSAQVINSGSPLTIVDTFDGVFGELRAGVSSQSVNGWTMFGEGLARFNEDSSEIGLTAGIRLRY